MSRLDATLTGACGLLLLCRSAAAAPPEDPGKPLFEEGSALYRQGRLPEAEEALERAWAVHESYEIAAQLGAVELERDKPREAAEHLRYALDHYPTIGTPAARSSIEARLANAAAQVGTATVTVSVEGAAVAIDGEPAGRAPLAASVFVDPGSRTFEARADGYETARQTVEVAPGSKLQVALALVRLTPAPAPAPQPAAPPDAGGTPRWEVAGPLLGIGAAGIVVGAAFAGVSSARNASVDERSAELALLGATACDGAANALACQELQDTESARTTFATASAWSFGLGAACAVAGIVWAAVAPDASEASGVQVQLLPIVGEDAAGAVFGSNF